MANGGKARLLRNDQQLGNHWLRVRLKDKANTGAIGAMIVIAGANDEKLARIISSTRSYLSATELTATFGFGEQHPTEMKILWPDGTTQTVPIEGLDREMVVEQGT